MSRSLFLFCLLCSLWYFGDWEIRGRQASPWHPGTSFDHIRTFGPCADFVVRLVCFRFFPFPFVFVWFPMHDGRGAVAGGNWENISEARGWQCVGGCRS